MPEPIDSEEPAFPWMRVKDPPKLLLACGLCGALVPGGTSRSTHEEFHEGLEGHGILTTTGEETT